MICTELSTDNYYYATFHKNMQNQYYNANMPLMEGVILPKIKLDLPKFCTYYPKYTQIIPKITIYPKKYIRKL